MNEAQINYLHNRALEVGKQWIEFAEKLKSQKPQAMTSGPCDAICADAASARSLANDAGASANAALSIWSQLDAIACGKEIECMECQLENPPPEPLVQPALT